jgi:NhaP-type Na+/H+ or K+/H+ antiporter
VRTVETVVLLVALATLVAAFARRLRVPAPSLLVVVGVVVGMLPRAPAINVPPDVVSLVVLPPLLYAASEELAWRDLRAVWRPVAVLAVGLVLASAAAVAAVGVAVASLSASTALVLGAVLASTDPVAVSALARRLSLPVRVQTLVQAESLFNDETSLVLYQIAVSLAVGGTAGMTATGILLHGVGKFVVLAGGGVLVGAVVAAGVIVVRRRITDPVLETVAALVTPYAAYLLGETFHVSGVTAVIVAGLVIGARRSRITTAQTRLHLHSVYQTVIFVLESVIFGLIGLELPELVRAIVISLVVQGFTLEPLARLAGFGSGGAAYPGHEETVARLRLAEAGLAHLNELAEDGAAPDAVIDRLRAALEARIGSTRDRLDQSPDTEPEPVPERELRADLAAAENAELARLFEDGTISAATRQRLQQSLDLEVTRLAQRPR